MDQECSGTRECALVWGIGNVSTWESWHSSKQRDRCQIFSLLPNRLLCFHSWSLSVCNLDLQTCLADHARLDMRTGSIWGKTRSGMGGTVIFFMDSKWICHQVLLSLYNTRPRVSSWAIWSLELHHLCAHDFLEGDRNWIPLCYSIFLMRFATYA